MVKILFICHGNICRSPMAEFIMKDMVEKQGLQDDFYICSAATSREEIGNPVYQPAKKILIQHNIGNSVYTDFRKKTARQITRRDYEEFDYILCAEKYNINNLKYVIGDDTDNKIYLLLDNKDIDDPWYSGDFNKAYNDIVQGCTIWLERLRNEK